MKDTVRLEDDLGYVRKIVDEAQRTPSPARIYLPWAIVTVPGFALIDFRPHVTGWYWLFAAPATFVLTGFLAWGYWRRLGQFDTQASARQIQHWAGMLLVIALAAFLFPSGVSHEAVGRVILLLLILGFWLAGVHLDSPMRWVAVLMAAGYLALALLRVRYAWTLLGLCVATGLVVAGFSGKSPNAKRTE